MDDLPPLPSEALWDAIAELVVACGGSSAGFDDDLTAKVSESLRTYARQAVLAERERCAKLCEGVAREYENYTVHDEWPDPQSVIDQCAAAIRKP